MRRQRILLKISDWQSTEEIGFVERSLGSRGRDILAIKLALGTISPASEIQARTQSDYSIGKNWFDCETGKEISTRNSIEFDMKLKNKLMTYQINNQFIILSYYFEKYGISKVNTKQDLLTQVLQAEQIFGSEFGNIGEGTIHAMHGWVPDADLKNTGYKMEAQSLQQVPMYFAQALDDGSLVLPERIEEFEIPPADAEPRSWYKKAKDDFPRFYRKHRDIANKVQEVVGMAQYKQTTSNSQLYSACESLFEAIRNTPKKSLDDMSRNQIDAIANRAFSPDPRTDPRPFVVDYRKIGVYVRTDYTLETLPKKFTEDELVRLKSNVLVRALNEFSKSMSDAAFNNMSEKVSFIDLHTPGLRPGDVYRAYFEIDKKWLDSLPDKTSNVLTPEEAYRLSSNTSKNIDFELEQVRKSIKNHYCADGGGFDDQEARLQYQKYRAFAAKNKKELARQIRDASQRSATNQENIGDNVSISLGPWGKSYSHEEIINTSLNLVEGYTTGYLRELAFDEADPTQIKMNFSDIESNVKRAVQNLRKSAKDVEDYKDSKDLSFSATTIDQEASKLSAVPATIMSLIKGNGTIRSFANDKGKTIEEMFNSVGFLGVARVSDIEINFDPSLDTKTSGSKISSIKINARVGSDLNHVSINPTGPLLDPTIVHYLRNIDNMGRSWNGALCPDKGGSQVGIGIRFIKRYRRPIMKPEKIANSDVLHPWHAPISGPVSEYVKEQVKRADTYVNPENRPTVTAYDILKKTRLVPTNFELSEVMPLLGDDCTWDDLQNMVGDRLAGLVCNYIECIRLPAVNIKTPNINLDFPDLPRFATFSWGWSLDEMIDTLLEILTRLLCNFITKLLDVLKNPFCGDDLVEDLYGAGSSQVPEAVSQALADSIIDIGVPTDQYPRIGPFIGDLSNLLTPRELCNLFEEGFPTMEVENLIRRIADRHGLNQFINTSETIYNLFTSLGIFIDPQLCENLQGYNDLLGKHTCKDTSSLLEQIRNRIAKNDDVTDEEIQNAMNLAQQNLLDESLAIEALLSSDGLMSAFNDGAIDVVNPDSPFTVYPKEVLNIAQDVADLIFEAPKMSYTATLKNFMPSMFLSTPAASGPGDANYNPQAQMLVQRHATNLRYFADAVDYQSEILGERTTTQLIIEAKEKLTILYHDYVKEDLEGDDIIDQQLSAVLEDEKSPPAVDENIRYRKVLVRDSREEESPEFEDLVKLTDADGNPYINYNEMLPITLSAIGTSKNLRPDLSSEGGVQVIDPSTRISTIEKFETWPEYENGAISDEVLGDWLQDVNQKIQDRLEQMNQEIAQNIEKAFSITDKSKFLSVLEEFYNAELEALREGTKQELITYRNASNALVLHEPYGMRYDANLVFKDDKSNEKRIPYKISVKDDAFLRKRIDFKYCQEIPEEYEKYGSFDEEEYPRRSLFKILYKKLMEQKSNTYVDDLTLASRLANSLGADIKDVNEKSEITDPLYRAATNPVEISSEDELKARVFRGSAFSRGIEEELYPKTAEGIAEQIASFLSTSRLFTQERYRDRLENILGGNSYYDEESDCIKNKFNLIGLSEIGFNKTIVHDFMTEHMKELYSEENNPLTADPSKPKALEKAIANVVVRAFVRLCIIEVLLKGAIAFSVWDLEYMLQDEFFKDYMEEYIRSEIERNEFFSNNESEFEDALIRTANRSNKFLALQTVITEELARFPKISKKLYNHDSSIDHSDWFMSVLPLVDSWDNPTSDADHARHPVSMDVVPTDANCFSHMERYLRLQGPLANAKQITSARYGSALENVSPLINRLRDTSFDRGDDRGEADDSKKWPKLEDYLVTEDSPELQMFDDTRLSSEVLSPMEFDFLINEVLYGDENLSRFFADLLYLIGPDQSSDRNMHGAPQALDRTPLRAIRRKRRFLKIDSAGRDEFLVGGSLFESLYENALSGQSEEASRNLIQSSKEQSDEDRFYIIPVDSIEYNHKKQPGSWEDSMTAEQFLESAMPRATQYFEDNFLLEEHKSRKFPAPTIEQDINIGEGYWNVINNSEPRAHTGLTLSQKPLSPSAPYIQDSDRPKDYVYSVIGQGVNDPYAQTEVYFWNKYGDVTESEWNNHLSSNPEIEEETWQETVIDLVAEAAPVFNIVGESFDRVVREGLPLDGASAPMTNVLKYLDDGESQLLVNQSYQAKGFTIRFDNLDARPRLGDDFGYKPDFQYHDERWMFEKPDIEREGDFGWVYATRNKHYKRNDYKIPIRILLTQILDKTGNVTAAFARCEIPEILHFNDDTKEATRHAALTDALSEICNDFTDQINSVFDHLVLLGATTPPDNPREKDKYRFVKEQVQGFPVFCRTPTNTLPTGPSGFRASYLSTAKLYSVASHLEVKNKVGNFTMDRVEVDKMFENRGMLLRETIWPAAKNISTITQDLKKGFGVAEIFDDPRFTEFFSAESEAIYRNDFLRANNFYDRSGVHRIVDGDGIDGGRNGAGMFLASLSNIISWFQQRKSDSFWGMTFNISNQYWNEQMFRTWDAQVGELTPGKVDQLPVEECFYRCGASMFYADGRTNPRQLFETLYHELGINLPLDQITKLEKLQRYEIFKKALRMFEFHTRANNEFFIRAYGPSHPDNPLYRENYVTFANEFIPHTSNVMHSAKHTMEEHQGKGNVDLLLTTQSGRDYTTEQAVEEAYEFMQKSPRWCSVTTYVATVGRDTFRIGAYIPFQSNLVPGMRDGRIIGDVKLTDIISSEFGKKLATTFNEANPFHWSARSVLDQLYGTSDFSPALLSKDRVYKETKFRTYMENQYNNLKFIDAIASDMRLRHAAALGPNGVNVLDLYISILAAYKANSEDGSPVVRNLIKDTTIYQGIRLVHTTPESAVSRQTFNSLLKMHEFEEIGNHFVKEEKLGLCRRRIFETPKPKKRFNRPTMRSPSGQVNVVEAIDLMQEATKVEFKKDTISTISKENLEHIEDSMEDLNMLTPKLAFNSVVADYEREIESMECWGLGSSFLTTFYGFDSFMKDKLRQTQDYKAYTEICFPIRKYCASMTVHSISLLSGYNTMPFVLTSTKELIAGLIQIVSTQQDYSQLSTDAFGTRLSSTDLKDMIDEHMTSAGPDACFAAPGFGKWWRIVQEMVAEMVKRFPALVLRGIAEQLDPAYREMKRHWMACDLDGFAWSGSKHTGQVIAPITRKKKTPLGIRDPGPKGVYAPVNLAMPVDMVYATVRLFYGDTSTMYRVISKLVGYIGKGNAPFLDPSYAFQIPCKDIDASGESAFNWDKFKFGNYGRYGHPLTIFTLLALSTPTLPGDNKQKDAFCVINNPENGQNANDAACEDEEE